MNKNTDINTEKNEILFRDYRLRQEILEYLILLMLSIIFLMLFSTWTSPYYDKWYGCDASFFSLVGRGITRGKVMYRDFYDLKGPYFFFIEAVGQLFCKGRFGIFLIQLIALFASVVLIRKITLLYVSKIKSAVILAIFFICHICTQWGGNTLEEFFLPVSLLCLYLVCLLLKDRDRAKPLIIPNAYAVLLGLSLGIIIFSKISIGGTILGIIAALSYKLIVQKRFKDLMIFIVYLLLGLTIAVFPMIYYFGYEGCLTDMLNCVFVVGFKRSQDFAELFNVTWELKCSGVIFAFIFAVTHMKRSDRDTCLVLMAASAGTYLLLHLGTPYYYYFTSAYPCVILALALMFKCYEPMIVGENKRQLICLLALGVFLLYYVPAAASSARTPLNRYSEDDIKYYEDSVELANFIPQFERDRVFSFMIDMQWYEINDMMPCNRYVVNLPFFIALSPSITDELIDTFENDPPKWLIIGEGFDNNLPSIAPTVNSKYSCIYTNSVGSLYLLDE